MSQKRSYYTKIFLKTKYALKIIPSQKKHINYRFKYRRNRVDKSVV